LSDLAGRRSKNRDELADQLCTGTWAGTADLVRRLVYSSMHAYGYRPDRAALLYALHDCNSETRMWMSPEQFQAWRKEARAIAKVRGTGKPEDEIGISLWSARHYSANGAPKTIALACAHYLHGHDLPVPANDWRALDPWYRARFGSTERVAEWLQISATTLSDRLRGFSLVKGEREPREPEAYLIRALDWLWRFGPFCPYGEKRPLELWPGQDLEGLSR
jgi:hypothetical protein